MQSVKISVITPTSNSAKTIQQCAESVASQNYPSFEHLIIDNVSIDSTQEKVLSVYSAAAKTDLCKFISEKDNGISDAFNKGIEKSSGEIVAILNSDDSYLSKNLFEKIAKLFCDENVFFVHGDVFFKDEIYGSNVRKPLLCPVTYAMPYNHPTMFFRKKIYDLYGGFDTSFKYAMDFEFICKLMVKIQNFSDHGYYYQEEPITLVSGGGASWTQEERAVHEFKEALTKNKLWTPEAEQAYRNRLRRVKMKKTFAPFGIRHLVKVWRVFKWK